jgi:hypothetical protein
MLEYLDVRFIVRTSVNRAGTRRIMDAATVPCKKFHGSALYRPARARIMEARRTAATYIPVPARIANKIANVRAS